jgi:hypothetical protein
VLGGLSSFKFAKYEVPREAGGAQRERGKVNTVQELVQWAKQQMPNESIERLFYVNYVKKLRIAQYLLADRVAQLRKSEEKVEICLDEGYRVAMKL